MKRLTSYFSRLTTATHPALRPLFTAALLSLLSSSLSALPVDLAAPPGGLGPTSDQGAAIHWVEMVEIDFGGGMTFPLRMSFLSSREEGDGRDFGPGHWRTPLHDSRLMQKKDGRWPLLLPCGKVMGLFPKAGEQGAWATADEEWIARPKGANTLVTREDGWELEFNPKGNLIRLKADNGRVLLWTRDADGSLRSVAEFAQGKLLSPAYSVTRDPATRRVKSLRVKTRIGTKEWRYSYDASDRLTSITFPDTSVVQNTYGSREDGHPWISITGRNAIATTLTWHKDNGSLLHDGVWSYEIQPQPGNNPIMRRTGPHGELEIHHDDALNHRTLFTAAEGTQTIKKRVTTGPAKGKLQSVTRILSANQEPKTKNQEQVLYSATYDSRGLLETETDALGHKTTHTYTLHGASIHTGIKTHSQTRPAAVNPVNPVLAPSQAHTTTQEFDKHGNLIASTNALGHTFRSDLDAQNRLLKTTGPDGTVIEAITYTKEGQIATRTDALGATTTYGYDQNGNRTSITDALGYITKHEYDLKGNRTATTDALGHTTRYEHDAGGRLTATILPEVQGAGLAKSQSQDGAAANSQPGTKNQEHRTSFAYDFAGRKLTTTAPDGTITEANTYDALGRLTSRTNALGHTTRYEYDVKRGSTGCLSCSTSGLPTRIISPSGRITERSYDTDRHLVSETIAADTPSSATTAHVYDSAGNRLSTTDPLGRITTFQYDSAGNRIKIIYPDNTEKTFAYNALGQPIAETNELGHTTKKEYDPYGNVIAVTTPEGHTTRTLFGESGTGLQPVVSPTGAAANATPGSMPQAPRLVAGHAARRLPHAIISPSGVTTSFHYDLLGRKITVTKAPGTDLESVTSHQFDAVGNEIATISSTGIKTTHTYDTRRRRISTTDAINRTWTFSYTDTAGPSGAPPCCGADPTSNSRAATTIHPDGSRDEKIYNTLGQLIETRDANITTANDELRTKNQEQKTGIRYAYDEDGRLTTLTDARGSVTKWRYDARGKLQSKTYPDNTVEAYEHDAAGQLVSRLRPNGVTASYTYSPRGKLLTIRWSDDKTEPSTFAYDAAGNMILAENHSAKITRTHTPEGRLQKETQQINYSTVLPPGSTPQAPSPFVAEVGYQYHEDGKLSELLYPDKSTVTYLYNQRGDLSTVRDSTLNQESGLKNQEYRYTRRADSKITSLSMPNGTTTTRTYDSVGRLSEIKHTAPDGSILFSETSRYDDRNRRTARQHADGSADLFAYDPAGQVTAAAYGEAANSTTKNEERRTPNFKPSQSFAYDPSGNRTQFTDSDTTITYQANEANQYTNITTGTAILEPLFDPLGNLLHDDQNTYTWDSDIHLLSVKTKMNQDSGLKYQESMAVYRYDALHRRVSRHESDSNTITLFFMDGWNVISEFSLSQSLKVSKTLRLAWGEDLSSRLQGAGGIGGLLVTKIKEQGITNFFHYDSNGNVITLSNAAAKESARYQYDAFGKTILAQGFTANLNRYQFSTKPVELSNELVFYGFRYYLLRSARWSSKDPIGERGGVNLFAFNLNNGISLVDFLGQSWISDSVGWLCARAVTGTALFDVALESNVTKADENGGGNAMTHCTSACRIEKACGHNGTESWNYRERECKPPNIMDLYNNGVGTQHAEEGGGCWHNCMESWKNGELDCNGSPCPPPIDPPIPPPEPPFNSFQYP